MAQRSGTRHRPLRYALAAGTLLAAVGQPVRAPAATPRAARKTAAADTGEPALLNKLTAAHWQWASARGVLPPVQRVYNETLETQDFTQYALDGGALRLCVSPGANGGDIFALLVDIRLPSYANFAKRPGSERYTTYGGRAYVVVLPRRPVSQVAFERLRAKQWTVDELDRQLGAPSFHWRVHEGGQLGLTYVPQGLSFIGDAITPVTYQLHAPEVEDEWRERHRLDRSLPPVQSLSELMYPKLESEVRDGFARELLNQRERIDQALARGKRSLDGRFVAGHANLAGGMAGAEVIVIREGTQPERRYRVPNFISDKGLLWLNARTVLFQVAVGEREFYTLDAQTGAMTLVAKTPADDTRPIADFGVLGPQRFWYKTADGQMHDVVVGGGAGEAHAKPKPNPRIDAGVR